MDDGVGGSFTRQQWLTSSQRCAQGAKDRARQNGQRRTRPECARAGEQGRELGDGSMQGRAWLGEKLGAQGSELKGAEGRAMGA
jgi:hypothetical protein